MSYFGRQNPSVCFAAVNPELKEVADRKPRYFVMLQKKLEYKQHKEIEFLVFQVYTILEFGASKSLYLIGLSTKQICHKLYRRVWYGVKTYIWLRVCEKYFHKRAS